jgi:methylated-DNA-[protein]-cysteine S-methyltransferase
MKRSVCAGIEADLVAAATGDADATAAGRVEEHIARCAPCREEYRWYRAVEGAVGDWRAVGVPASATARARTRLEALLADLRHRTILYRIFPSPLGNLLIGVSDRGVSLLEYLGRSTDLSRSRLAGADVDVQEDGSEIEPFYRQLLEYLEGRRTRLNWPLDLRLVRTDFHRTVLEATAGIPYGAVMSYAGVACEVGRPSAVRAVAQALRRNPLPIVVPCHRVVGASGSLTGYAGHKTGIKQRLLTTEGVPVVSVAADLKIPRETMYVGEPNDPWYCLPTCSSLKGLRHPYRVMLFGSRASAEAAGRAPCSTCRPDLHPLA